jgi:hypothetical protein
MKSTHSGVWNAEPSTSRPLTAHKYESASHTQRALTKCPSQQLDSLILFISKGKSQNKMGNYILAKDEQITLK